MPSSLDIALPHRFIARDYQIPFLEAMVPESGKKRGILIWHRRCGKDKTLINFLVMKAMQRKGTYYYFFPEYAQGKKVLWEGQDKMGLKFLDHIPKELIDGKPNETEMKIKFTNGSLFQIIGTDNFNAIRGTNPVGCVFSEFSYQDPEAWNTVRPILDENEGWAVFNYTPNGKNHGYDLYETNKENPLWFVQKLSIEDTQAVSKETIKNEIESGASPEFIDQEFYCSFEGSKVGAYYAEQMAYLERENRITSVPYDATTNVSTYWDLGIGDAMAIWFVQRVGLEFHFIDYIEASGESIAYYAQKLKERGYTYDRHYYPHDGQARELSTGKSRKEAAEKLGIRPIFILPAMSVDDGINAVRMKLSQCWFDKVKCKRGIECLKNYSKEWDSKNKEFRSYPKHDWSSHGADAIRMWALAVRDQSRSGIRRIISGPKRMTTSE